MDKDLAIQAQCPNYLPEQWFAECTDVEREHSDTQALETQWPRREDRRGRVRAARMGDCNSESGDLGPQLGSPPASNVTLSTRWL